MSILFNRALLLAKIEANFGEDPVPTAAADAFLIEVPNFEPDITLLQRQNVKTSLSPDSARAGRKIARVSFAHEVRGYGAAGVEPKLGTLLKACGMGLTTRTASAADTVDFGGIRQIARGANSTGAITGAAGTSAYLGDKIRTAIIAVTTGGTEVGGAARISITVYGREGEAANYSEITGVTVADGPIVLTDGVATPDDGEPDVVLTFTGTFAVGDKFAIDLVPPGYYYKPVSALFPSVALYLYYGEPGQQGLFHKLLGARGTFRVEGVGGGYAKFAFQFTGNWNDPVDAEVPDDAVYETTTPPIVELADLYAHSDTGLGGALCAQSFNVDIGNEVSIRECINAASAYEGAEIVGRRPVGGMNPEAVIEAVHPFWNLLSTADNLAWHVKVGTVAGNRVHFYAPSAQYTGLGYADRNGIRAYDVGLNFASVRGDDELVVAFT